MPGLHNPMCLEISGHIEPNVEWGIVEQNLFDTMIIGIYFTILILTTRR